MKACGDACSHLSELVFQNQKDKNQQQRSNKSCTTFFRCRETVASGLKLSRNGLFFEKVEQKCAHSHTQ
ncbi:chitin-binding domain-containing protein [Cronobacter turicensis]|uniref:chitin-binding domain-containing protein n=1 Tax=Cronobacter turicensis TaxID=413502 RepID=UPI003D343645